MRIASVECSALLVEYGKINENNKVTQTKRQKCEWILTKGEKSSVKLFAFSCCLLLYYVMLCLFVLKMCVCCERMRWLTNTEKYGRQTNKYVNKRTNQWLSVCFFVMYPMKLHLYTVRLYDKGKTMWLKNVFSTQEFWPLISSTIKAKVAASIFVIFLFNIFFFCPSSRIFSTHK